MKTRIIKTKFWSDPKVLELDHYAKYLFVHLLSCDRINMCGIFEYADEEIKLYTSLKQDTLDKAKTTLQEKKRVLFHDGWVMVSKAEKHNSYHKSPKNSQTYENEMREVPLEVKEYFERFLDGEIKLPEKKKKAPPASAKRDFLLNIPDDYIAELIKDYPNLTPEIIKEQGNRAYHWSLDKNKTSGNFKSFLRNWVARTSDSLGSSSKPLTATTDESVSMSPEVLKHAQPKK